VDFTEGFGVTEVALVSGGSGYLALELIQQLLASGSTVHTTVRKLGNEAKVRPLKKLQERFPEKLKIFEADLLVPGAFGPAMQGCTVVFHVASPFLLPEKIKDGRRQMLEPALNGTRNVLETVNRTPSVARVVMTSTIGAIFGDYIDVRQMENETLSEKYFNTSSTLETYPYHFAKVEAEKEAWRIFKAQSRWSFVVMNPSLVLGPSLTTASESGSLFLLDEMMRGRLFFGLPDWSMATVDVREAAEGHIAAARNPNAQGRYILSSPEMISLIEIARILRKVHKRPWLLPRVQLPNFLVMTFGPIWGLGRDYMRKHLGIRFKLDNSRSIAELGIKYRPVEETIVDHYRSWLALRQSA
jgi:nucleoside-diphosphate-sugar epimerase